MLQSQNPNPAHYSLLITHFWIFYNFAKKINMGLLRTLLILFIIFYVIRLVTRFFLPMLFKNYVDDKMNEMAGNQKKQQQRQKEQARKREGEVSIDYNPRQGDSKGKNDKGDYVDYVEVKD